MKTWWIIFLCLLVFVAGLAVGYHIGHQPGLQSKLAVGEKLLAKSDGYYWYYRNVWLPNYLTEHGVQYTGQQIIAGSSQPTNR
jgi:hypothetical protein